MDDISWVVMLVAVGLGLGVGALVLGAGLWLDRIRGRWERELEATDAPRDIVDRGHDTDGS